MYCVGLAVVRVVHVLCWSSCSEGGACTVLLL